MEKLRVFDYQGSPIQFEEVDGKILANATLMCNAFNKKPAEWIRLDSTKRYIEAVMRKSHIGENELIIIKRGGNEIAQGTWVHEKLILSLARWLSVDFEVWCDEKIAELLRKGSVDLKRLSPAELILQQAQQLVDHERRLDDIDNRVKKIEAGQPENITCFTIMGYARIKHTSVNEATAKQLGIRASRLCQERGLKTSLTPHVKYGNVRVYPQEVLEQVYTEHLKQNGNH